MKAKSENRKAMPKFILIIIGSLLLGIVLGIGIIFVKGSWSATLGETIMATLTKVSPWVLLTFSVISAVLQYTLYKRAKTKFSNWQEEDEDTLEKIDNTLTVALMINSMFLILSYGFVGVPFSRIDMLSIWEFALCLLGLVIAMVVMVLGQQKLVDFAKKLYPEKRGSIYDPKFQKIWYESCDEAERALIGQAAMSAYKATGTACLLLWVVLLLGDMLFHFGFLPSAVVCVIWLVNTLSYCINSIKCSKKSNTK